MTLTEVLVASAVATIVVLGFAAMEASRTASHGAVRVRSGVLWERPQVALAAAIQLSRSFEAADRIVLPALPGRGIQFRTFAPTANCGTGCVGVGVAVPDLCCYDQGANYRWDHIVWDTGSGELRFYQNTSVGCGAMTVLARNITTFTVVFPDNTTLPPPGGEPWAGTGSDNNTIQYQLIWTDQGISHGFRGEATARSIPYSAVNTTPNDTGSGLAPVGVANPPGSC